MAGPLGLEDPGPPAPKAWDIKDVFPEETIDWKHVSVIIIIQDTYDDNLETSLQEKG